MYRHWNRSERKCKAYLIIRRYNCEKFCFKPAELYNEVVGEFGCDSSNEHAIGRVEPSHSDSNSLPQLTSKGSYMHFIAYQSQHYCFLFTKPITKLSWQPPPFPLKVKIITIVLPLPTLFISVSSDVPAFSVFGTSIRCVIKMCFDNYIQ